MIFCVVGAEQQVLIHVTVVFVVDSQDMESELDFLSNLEHRI